MGHATVRVYHFLFLLAIASIISEAALAIPYVTPVPTDNCGDVDPTIPCYTSTRPTTTACTAYVNKGQKCRKCYTNRYMNPDGSERLEKVCLHTTTSVACHCDMTTVYLGCTNVGTCTVSYQ